MFGSKERSRFNLGTEAEDDLLLSCLLRAKDGSICFTLLNLSMLFADNHRKTSPILSHFKLKVYLA